MDKPETLATLGTQKYGTKTRDTGNIGHTKTRDEDKPETLATLGTQKYGTKIIHKTQ